LTSTGTRYRLAVARYPREVWRETMSENLILSVPGVSCEHCRTAITREVGVVAGVESVDVDLDQ
jgi:hypothetical protein